MHTPELLHRLLVEVGPTLTAFVAGVDKERVQAWLRGEGAPTPDQVRRLTSAHEVFRVVADVDGEQVARLWFVGMNPWLDDASPADALRRGELDAVRAAARAARDDSWGG